MQLRPVTSKRVPEIAYQLLDVFSIFAAPNILQSDNGREFVNSIIEELRLMWEGLKIVHGNPRHNQSQGSVERANDDYPQTKKSKHDDPSKNMSATEPLKSGGSSLNRCHRCQSSR